MRLQILSPEKVALLPLAAACTNSLKQFQQVNFKCSMPLLPGKQPMQERLCAFELAVGQKTLPLGFVKPASHYSL